MTTKKPPSRSPLTAALDYAKLGLPVFPSHSIVGDECTCGNADCEHPAKHPRIRDWPNRATTDAGTIRRWWRQWPNANVSILTGGSIVAIDVDPRNGGDKSLAKLKKKHSRLPKTVEAFTGGGGRHLIFKHPGGKVKNREIAPGVEVKGDGGCITFEPSIHASGNRYRFKRGCGPDKVQVAPLPKWLLHLVRGNDRTARKKGKHSRRDGSVIPIGDRNSHLTSLAGSMRRRNMSESAILTALSVENGERCVPQLPSAEVERIARSVSQYAPNGGDGPSVLSKAPPFPTHVFPKPLAEFVREVSRALPCPPEHVGVPMLTCIGAAIGNRREIEVKPNWREGPRIYAAVVARPGDRKSPALEHAGSPIRRRQEVLRRQYQAARKRYERQLSGWNRRGTRPEEPVLEQVLTTDATLESLAVLLQQNQRGILLVRDELTAWVRAMNQYRAGRGGDRQYWLSFWSGSQVVVNRKTQPEPIIVDKPMVCVVGCIPPDVLGDLTDLRGREDGFVHRILFAYPDSMSLEWSDSSVSNRAIKKYEEVFQELWELPEAVLRFTRQARTVYVKWVDQHYAELNELQDNLRGAWAKLDGYCARLALVLHESRRAARETRSNKVDRKSVEGAIELVEYFKGHARRIYKRLATEHEDRRFAGAVQWIRRKGGKTSARDIQKYKVAGVTNNAEAKQLLHQLEGLGYGQIRAGKHKAVDFQLMV